MSWLEFLNPWGFLGLIGVPIVILIYIIKSRYVQKPVSSTFIWKRSVKYVKRRIPINFIMSFLLILQILTVVLGTLAITQPRIKPLTSNEKIVIVDASASMKTEVNGVSRFDNAKEQVKNVINKAGANNQVTLIVAGTRSEFAIQRSSSPVELQVALDQIECSEGAADVDGALECAKEILEANSEASIMFFTDKEYLYTDDVEVIDCSGVGETNVAVIAMTDIKLTAGYKYTGTIANYGSEDVECEIKLYIDGLVAQSTIATIPPGETTTDVIFTPIRTTAPGENEVISWMSSAVSTYGRAEIKIETEDSFTEDNSFVIYQEEEYSPKILYVSNKVTLKSDGTGVDSTKVTPLQRYLNANGYFIKNRDTFRYIDDVPSMSGYDIYIFEGVAPATLPTDGAIWLLCPPDNVNGTNVTLNYQNAQRGSFAFVETDAAAKDEISTTIKNNVSFTATPGSTLQPEITRYVPLTVNPNHENEYKSIYSCGEHTVMVAGNIGSSRVIITSFDFSNSYLAWFVTDFTLFIRNFVNYSAPRIVSDNAVDVGSDVVFHVPTGATSVQYVFEYEEELEDGTTQQRELIKYQSNNITSDDLVRTMTLDKIGIYKMTVTFGDGTTQIFAATANTPESESRIFELGETLDAPEPSATVIPELEKVDVFPYLMMVLIFLLIVEWGVYYRDKY